MSRTPPTTLWELAKLLMRSLVTGMILRLLIFIALAVVVWKAAVLVARARRKKPQTELKCATCVHCDLIDDDGVMCRYGDTITLKTPIHVRNCMDYEVDPKPARRGRR